MKTIQRPTKEELKAQMEDIVKRKSAILEKYKHMNKSEMIYWQIDVMDKSYVKLSEQLHNYDNI